jgi:hypothetical protein
VSGLVLPQHFEQSVDLHVSPEEVFKHLDDFTQFGEHMMRSSWMMAGSSMRYEFDGTLGRAPGARVRLLGSFLGAHLEIEEYVVERTPPLRKSWETVGRPRMIVLEAYRMGFAVMPTESGCRLQVFIDYSRPRRGLGWGLGWIAAGPYARWCVRSTIAGVRQHFAAAEERIEGSLRTPVAPH